MERAQWKSNLGFLLAAAGSAIGLGNIWRFPYLCYKNGGGAFLVPYVIALLLVGIPVLVLELALGHRKKASAPMAFHLVGGHWEWVGWYPVVLVMFGIMFYYSVIIGWCVNFLWYSFDLRWGSDPAGFFFGDFLKLGEKGEPWQTGDLRTPIVFSCLLVWGAIWFICYREIQHGIERACKVFIPLLFLLSLVLIVYTWIYPGLPGAADGIRWYLVPRWEKLKQLDPWRDAFGQIFFTLSIGFGIMIAYASYLPRRSNIVKNGVITAFLNCGYSFFNGFAVFGVLGFMAAQRQIPSDSFGEVVKEGAGLAFVIYPEAISHLPLWKTVFGLIFFLVLILAGLSSAISIMEAFAAGIMDKFGLRRKDIMTMLCVFGFLGSLLFTHNTGLFWLDIVDHFLNMYGLLVVGFLECVVLGWFYKTSKLGNHLTETSGISRLVVGSWVFLIRVVCPAVLGILIAFSIHEELTAPYYGYDPKDGSHYPVSALVVLGLFWVLATLMVGILLSTISWKSLQKEET